MEHKIPTGPGHTAEGGHAPVFPHGIHTHDGCSCISPRIYVGGEILDTCQRCGKPYRKKKR